MYGVYYVCNCYLPVAYFKYKAPQYSPAVLTDLSLSFLLDITSWCPPVFLWLSCYPLTFSSCSPVLAFKMAVYSTLFQCKGVKGNMVSVCPTFQPGEIIQFISEVAPGDSSGPALAVVLSQSPEGVAVEVLSCEDTSYFKYLLDRGPVPRLVLAKGSKDLHADTDKEMITGIVSVGNVEKGVDFKTLSWIPRHRRTAPAR